MEKVNPPETGLGPARENAQQRAPEPSPASSATGSPVPAIVEPHVVAVRPVEIRPIRKRLRYGLISALIVLAAAVATAYFWTPTKSSAVNYKAARVDRGPVTATVTATGTVNPILLVQVGSQVSGIIQSLFADYNSVVKKNQVVALIDPAPFQAKVSQARASLRTARGNLQKAQADVAQRKLEQNRAAELQKQDFVAQADLDLAQTNYKDALAQVEVSRAAVEQAEAALASTELDLSHTKIYSPVDGIIVSRNVDVGQTVAASLQAPTLFLIAQDLTHMQVDTNVSESDIGGVTQGTQADFTVDAYPSEVFQGKVVQVRNAPISIQNVVTYDVVIAVENRNLKLKPGMTANVSIVTARKDDAIRVPSAALRFKLPGAAIERQKSVVWVLGAQGAPKAIPIKPGIADANFTEVRDGDLKDGDAVIVGIDSSDQAKKALPPGFGGAPPIR